MISSPCSWLLLSLILQVTALYPYGPEIDRTLPSGDDVSTEVSLQVPIRFYGQLYQSIYVNTNGLLSFLTAVPVFYNEPFPLEYPVVAPFYSNVDTRGGGEVFYRESRDPELLAEVEQKIANSFPSAPRFQPLAVFIATWHDVGYFNSKSDKTNTFQAAIASDGVESYVELLYPLGRISWIRAESVVQNSLPDARAQAGLSSPGGKLALLKGSGTDRVHNLPSWTNTFVPGEYMFRVGNIEEIAQPEPPQVPQNSEESGDGEPRSCAEDGALLCHKYSQCYDQEEGFCCKCDRAYIGDGRNCLDSSSSHRMIGKINMSLNGEEFRDLNMQAYIVTTDGRTYTAVSGVPASIGYNSLLLTNLGSFLGFLFAKPIGEAPNGYQLTGGVVNHTADISIDRSYRVTMNQRYTGLNLFEQVKMEAEVIGTLPPIPRGSKLNVLDYQEHFTRVAPGSFRSQSSHTVEVEGTDERHEITVYQTISFKEFCPSTYRNLRSLRLKSSRHFLNYEERDSILRLASTNKISQNSEGQDPCLEGHVLCVANSTCLVEDDTFRCVCDAGFQALSSDQVSECVDINECEDGSATCHIAALCVNEVGSYSCECQPGYRGNGRQCEAIETALPPNVFCSTANEGHQRICYCKPGFNQIPDESVLGFKCEDIDECATSKPCDSSAYCRNYPGGFTCQCLPGFIGDGFLCKDENEENDCDNKDCPDGSECRETSEGPECFCPEGTAGIPPYCEQKPIYPDPSRPYQDKTRHNESSKPHPEPTEPYPPEDDSCLQDNKCDNNAQCIFVPDSKTYECRCNPGFEGDGYECTEFEESIEYCEEDSECRENFICAYNSSKGLSLCTCRPGYVLDQTSCLPPATDSSFVRTCIQGECWCPPGYIDNGELCVLNQTTENIQHSCLKDNKCDNNAQCIFVPDSKTYECRCNPGFEGDGYECTEFEVSCNTQSQICDINAECRFDSSSGRHICICKENYQGDGTTCYPSMEHCRMCSLDAHCTAESCICNEGFVGDGFVCEKKIPGCDSLKNCDTNAKCLYNEEEQGYRCKCSEGFEGDGYSCVAVDSCQRSSELCSEFATCKYIEEISKFECKCIEGYYGDGKTCKVLKKQEEEYLFVNRGTAIMRVPLQATSPQVGSIIYVNPVQQAVGITVDCAEKRVYWSDITYQKIFSSNFHGQDVQEFMKNVMSPEGLALDWDNRVLYWTDSALRKISSADLQNQAVDDVISKGPANPRGIAVHPFRRKLFWSDWNRKAPKIESCNLDVRKCEIIVQAPNVSLPNSLAIDYDTNEICWADAGLKTIECYNFDTRILRTVVRNCLYPFGLAITSDAYYWTDWSTSKVERSRKGSGVPTDSIKLQYGSGKLYGLAVVTSTCPNTSYLPTK